MMGETGILPLESLDFRGKRVLLRVDINSPIDPVSKKIVSENRINESIPTIRYLLDQGARLALIAHQGDTLDYQNLIPLKEHAKKLSSKIGILVRYVDDVAGPEAQKIVKKLKPSEAVLLGNLRYLTEEVSTFENSVKLKPEEMLNTYLLRNFAPLFDIYVNDAFAAAHRNAPSMVAFQEILPTAGGLLLIKEYKSLKKILENPERPALFILGGAKISDAFGMMKQVLENRSADRILACGVVALVMLLAKGINLGVVTERFLRDRSLDVFIEPTKNYLSVFPDKILLPSDFAIDRKGARVEVGLNDLPASSMLGDIGKNSIESFQREIFAAGTIFMNGPPGIYENKNLNLGTREILRAVTEAKGYSLIGGGDTVNAAQKFVDTSKINYVSTAGGAMIRFLSGVKLPLIDAMEKAFKKWH